MTDEDDAERQLLPQAAAPTVRRSRQRGAHALYGERGEPLTRGRLRGIAGLPESGDDSELNFDA